MEPFNDDFKQPLDSDNEYRLIRRKRRHSSPALILERQPRVSQTTPSVATNTQTPAPPPTLPVPDRITSSLTVEQVVLFCQKNPDLSFFAEVAHQHKVSGRAFLYMTVDDMVKMGVSELGNRIVLNSYRENQPAMPVVLTEEAKLAKDLEEFKTIVGGGKRNSPKGASIVVTMVTLVNFFEKKIQLGHLCSFLNQAKPLDTNISNNCIISILSLFSWYLDSVETEEQSLVMPKAGNI